MDVAEVELVIVEFEKLVGIDAMLELGVGGDVSIVKVIFDPRLGENDAIVDVESVGDGYEVAATDVLEVNSVDVIAGYSTGVGI